MANRYLFAGGEMDSVVTTAGVPLENNNAAGFDATYCRNSLFIDGHGQAVRASFVKPDGTADAVAIGETFWWHQEYYYPSFTTVQGHNISFNHSGGTAFLRFCSAGTNNIYQLQYWTGSAWTAFGSNYTLAPGRWAFDFSILITSSGNITVGWYVNNVLVSNASASPPSATGISSVGLSGNASNNGAYHSQLLGTVGIPTINAKVASARATGAGASNTFTSGVFGDITEATLSDGTVAISNTAGQKYTMVCSDVTIPTGYAIATVFTWTRAKHGGAAPTNLKHVIRSSAVDYPSANVTGMSLGMLPLGIQWVTNPGGGAWSLAGFNAIELGAESAT